MGRSRVDDLPDRLARQRPRPEHVLAVLHPEAVLGRVAFRVYLGRVLLSNESGPLIAKLIGLTRSGT